MLFCYEERTIDSLKYLNLHTPVVCCCALFVHYGAKHISTEMYNYYDHKVKIHLDPFFVTDVLGSCLALSLLIACGWQVYRKAFFSVNTLGKKNLNDLKTTPNK